MDAPETKRPNTPFEYYGKEVSAFTKNMAEGKKVRLEYVWPERNKYGEVC